MVQTILIINISTSLFLTGVIWFVQVVQYPGFHKVMDDNFQEFHRFHIVRISFVVTLPMIIELGTSAWLTISFEQFWLLNAVGLALVAVIWISTFAVQLTIHRKLQEQQTQQLITQLIHTNWIRTSLWTTKTGLGIYLLLTISRIW